MASMKDVAKAAGVSTATVSRVLTNSPYVSQAIKEKVKQAVTALDYRPNRVARSLRVQSSHIIGLIVADIQNPFFTSVSRAVQDAAYENGMNVFLCNTDEKKEKEKIYLDLMRDENVAGVIIAPTHQSKDSVQRIINLGIPTVIIDRKIDAPDQDMVLVDNRTFARHLTLHMIKQGCRKIALFAGSSSRTGILRQQGYLDALKESGIENNPDYIHFVPATEASGYKICSRLLEYGREIEGIIVTNGLLGAGVYQALKEHKIVIPGQIALSCFDDLIWTKLAHPPVTVIKQPTHEIGQAAVELLLNRIKEKNKPITSRQVFLKAQLIVRQSTLKKI